MPVALDIVILAVVVTAVSALARKYALSAPLVLVSVGFVASYVPFVPTPDLTPEIVLVGFLPPLLYAAAIRTSLIDIHRNKRPILLLSVGLVVFTTAGVGLLVWWLLPVSLAAALALGAVVSPPDAVAATAIARRGGMPRRVVTILEGESLVNDAAAGTEPAMAGIDGPDPAEDHLQEASVYQRAARAGINELEEALTGDEPDEVVQRLRQRTIERSNAVWERLGSQRETPSVMYARLRERMLQAEREEVLRVRRLGLVDQQVLRNVLDALDVEETVLDQAVESSSSERKTELRAPQHHDGCEHLQAHETVPQPRTPEGCEECLRDGTEWVHLRLCMDCGHVGCCDSSPQVHADAHWRDARHPVVRSFETGEAWR